MGIDNEKLDRFIKAVDDEVDVEIDKILSEALQTKDEILIKANDSCLNMAYDRIQGGMKRISSKYIRLVAAKELESRREVLVHREGLAAKIFDEVREKLTDYINSTEYKTHIVLLINSELKKTEGKATVFLSQQDMANSAELKKMLLRDAEFFADKDIRLGGAKIVFSGENIAVDKTFDSAVEEQRELFNQSSDLRLC